MSTLGQRLREEREKRGLTIEQLAERTCIQAHHFEAIERDDRESLPGGFFYRSFVRQYARILELPQEAYQAELDRSLRDEAEALDHRETALPERNLGIPPLPTGTGDGPAEVRRWLARVGSLAAVVVVCTGVYWLWQRYRPEGGPEQSSGSIVAARQDVPAASAPAQAQTAPPQAATQEPRTQPEPAQTAAARPAPEMQFPAVPATRTEPEQPPAPAGAIRLTVRAIEMTWLDVWQGEKKVFASLLRPGDTKTFTASGRLRVRLGSAGAAELEWNGQSVPPTGPKGQVRTLDFTPGEWVLVPPPRQPSDRLQN
jgi:cytoskeleton protein RodZ